MTESVVSAVAERGPVATATDLRLVDHEDPHS
jgi:hypothetical protein